MQGAAYAELLKTSLELDAQMRAREEFLDTPAQEQEREQSETEHRSESRAEAAETTRESFEPVLEGLDWQGSKLARDDAFESFSSDYVARVEVGGESRLIESSVPLRARDDDGALAPVDLTLERQADGSLEPQNAAVPVELPRMLEDGLEVGAGTGAITITPTDAAGATSAVTLEGVAAQWSSTSTDTDFLAAPVPQGGLETFTQLRSPAAPEVSKLRVASEHGDIALVPSPTGEVFVNRDGVRIGRFAPAWAVDAQGTQVKVQTTVEDDTIVLEVNHRDADLAYPILIDPIYEDWFNGGRRWDQGSTTGLRDGTWQYAENPAGWYPHDTRCISGVNCGGTGDGFYIYTYANAPYSNAGGHYAEYYYTVHEWNQRSTYIPRVDYWQKNFWWGANANFWSLNGIWAPNRGNWTGYQLPGQYQDSNNTQYVALRSGDSINTIPAGEGKQAVWGALPNGNYHPSAAALSLGASIVYLDDQESPTLNVSHSAPAPTGWVRDYNDRISFNATDGGLGILAFNVFYGSKVWTSWQPTFDGGNCSGGKGRPCYTYRNGYFDLTAQALGDGTHALGVCAYDAVYKSGSTGCKATRTVNIDRTGPSVVLSGDLWSGGNVGANYDPRDLVVAATDATSGVSSVAVTIDGVALPGTPISGASAACTCRTFRYPGGHGVRTITVTVRDRASNEWTKTWAPTITDPAERITEPGANEDRAGDPEPAPIDEAAYCSDNGGVCVDSGPTEPSVEDRSGTTPAEPFGWGVADPGVEFFDMPEFHALIKARNSLDPSFVGPGVRHVRVIVPWDLMTLGVADSGTRICPIVSNSAGAVGVDQFTVPKYGTYAGGTQLGLPYVDNSLAHYTQWLEKARSDGLEVTVAFGRTERGESYCYLPSEAEYKNAVTLFRDRFPWVRNYAAWNEPDLPSQPTSAQFSLLRTNGADKFQGAYRAGRFWRILQTEICQSTCRVAAGEFTEALNTKGGPGTFLKRYIDGTRDGRHVPPKIWSIHAYGVADNGPIGTLSNYLKSTRSYNASQGATAPRIWLTEQSPRYHKFRTPPPNGLGLDPVAATMRTGDGISNLFAANRTYSRIDRLFWYDVIAPAEGAETYPGSGVFVAHPHDSGMLAPDRNPRPGYTKFLTCVKTNSCP